MKDKLPTHNMFSRLIMMFIGSMSIFVSLSSPANSAKSVVVSQHSLYVSALQKGPLGDRWVKPQPGFGYRLPEDPSQIPEFIKANIGNIDDINRYQPEDDKFSNMDEFFKRNSGNVLSLQYANGEADFYVIRDVTWQEKYGEIEFADAFEKNKALLGKLANVKGLTDWFKTSPNNLIGTQILNPTTLVRLSELGYPIEYEIIVPIPEWGENYTQTKKAGTDAFVAFEVSGATAYIINTEAVVMGDGQVIDRPIAYVPKKEAIASVDLKFSPSPAQSAYLATFETDIANKNISLKLGYYPEEMNINVYSYLVEQVQLSLANGPTIDVIEKFEGMLSEAAIQSEKFHTSNERAILHFVPNNLLDMAYQSQRQTMARILEMNELTKELRKVKGNLCSKALEGK